MISYLAALDAFVLGSPDLKSSSVAIAAELPTYENELGGPAGKTGLRSSLDDDSSRGL
jgi:hypothetical protein